MRLLPIGTFILRHLIAVPLIAAALCLGWIVLYFILLVIAAISDSGIGGPLALPAGLIFIVLLAASVGWGVFTPACAVGATVCSLFRLPKLAAIPIVWVATCVFGYAIYWLFIRFMTTHSMPPASDVLLYSALFLSIPVGIYWWITEGPIALFDLGRRLWKRFKPK